jgi:anaerobic selenocysteine-containing dehydrogenase
LCEEGRFATADGRARFSVPELADNDPAPDTFSLTTRRGKQFNSMVQAQRDPLTGAARDSVLMSPVDAQRLGFGDGDRIELAADSSRYQGRVMLAEVIPGSLQVHWPEGNVLVNRSRRSTESGIPDYNAVVRVRRVSP